MEPGAIVFLIVLTLFLLLAVPLAVGWIFYDPKKLAAIDKAEAEQELDDVYRKMLTEKAEGRE